MNQIKYAIEDIKNNKKIYIMFFVEMGIVTFLVYYIFFHLIGVNKYRIYMNSFSNKNIYLVRDKTSKEKIGELAGNSKEVIPKMRELYSFIKNNPNITQCHSYTFGSTESINGKGISFNYINKEYFNLNNYQLIKGNNFTEKDFIDNSGVVSVLVGYSLSNKYKLNKVYDIKDLFSGEDIKIKVIGILKYNSYALPIHYGITQYLNYNVILPIRYIDEATINDFSQLDVYINNALFISNDLSSLKAIEDKSKELDLFDLEYESMENHISDNLILAKNEILKAFVICIIFLIITVISIITSTKNIIEKNKKNYFAHILYGATKLENFKRIILSTIVIDFLLFIGLFILAKEVKAVIFTVLTIFILTFISEMIPLLWLYKVNANEMIRRKE